MGKAFWVMRAREGKYAVQQTYPYEAYNTTENQWGKQRASMAIIVVLLTLISKY